MGYFCRAAGCGTEIEGGQEVWVDRSGAVLPRAWVGRPIDPRPTHPACASPAGAGPGETPLELNLAPGTSLAPAEGSGPAAPAAPSLGLNLAPGGRPQPGVLFGRPRVGQGRLW